MDYEVRGFFPLPRRQYRQSARAVERWRCNRYRMVHCQACMCSEIPALSVRLLAIPLMRYLPRWEDWQGEFARLT